MNEKIKTRLFVIFGILPGFSCGTYYSIKQFWPKIIEDPLFLKEIAEQKAFAGQVFSFLDNVLFYAMGTGSWLMGVVATILLTIFVSAFCAAITSLPWFALMKNNQR